MKNNAVIQQILDRIEGRIQQFGTVNTPTLKVIAIPESADSLVVQPKDIYSLYSNYAGVKRVSGGVCVFTEPSTDDNESVDLYFELNEYGVVYYRRHLHENRGVPYFINCINHLLKHATTLYKSSDTSINVRVHAVLDNVFKEKLADDLGKGRSIHLNSEPVCYDSEVCVSTAETYASTDFDKAEHQKTILEELTMPLLWSFNVNIDSDPIVKYIRGLISDSVRN